MQAAELIALAGLLLTIAWALWVVDALRLHSAAGLGVGIGAAIGKALLLLFGR